MHFWSREMEITVSQHLIQINILGGPLRFPKYAMTPTSRPSHLLCLLPGVPFRTLLCLANSAHLSKLGSKAASHPQAPAHGEAELHAGSSAPPIPCHFFPSTFPFWFCIFPLFPSIRKEILRNSLLSSSALDPEHQTEQLAHSR